MISAAIKPFIYRQVIRSCSTNSVSSCCKDMKWLCTFGFSELRDRNKTKIHLMCFKSNSEKQKKKKKVRFSSEFRWQLSNRWNSSNWFTVAALNKKKLSTPLTTFMKRSREKHRRGTRFGSGA